MATAAKLCSTCTGIFLLKDGQKSSISRNNHKYHAHHNTLDSLRKAVHQGCFICTRSWTFFGKECQTDWNNDVQSWRPLKYNLTTLEGLKTIVLSIRWSTPNLGYTTPAKFHLRPTSAPVPEKKLSLTEEKSDTSSTLSLGQAYQWYMSCRSGHRECRHLVRTPRWCPTRLVDIGPENEPNWKLQLTSVDIHTPVMYMTLSYTWGSSSFLKLTKSNVDVYRRGSLIKDLPRTFQDMITVARRFSIRYIWIDSLCILQDSKEDWEKEASMMRDVYANSSCNVAAAASADPHGGLFRSRLALDIEYGLVWSDALGSTGQFYHIIDEAYWDRQVSNAILHQRGWVLQERLLAPRTLHFTEHQIFWECFIDQKCEAFPSGLPEFLPTRVCKPVLEVPDHKSQSLRRSAFTIKMWKNIVEQYTSCVLTMPNDKMIALSGLAKVYQNATGDDYIGGLWKSQALESLRWHVPRPVKRRYSEYRAPSWSWAATDGAVKYDTSHSHYLARVLGVQVLRSPLDSTDQVYGGFIDIEAVIVPVTYIRVRDEQFWCDLKIDDDNVGRAMTFEDNLGEGLGDKLKLHCLAISYDHRKEVLESSFRQFVYLEGMLLRPISENPGNYTRIGYFGIHDSDALKRKFGILVDPETNNVTQDEKISPSKIRIH